MSAKHTTFRDFPIHSLESAPDDARAALNWYNDNFSMVPLLAGVLAEAPALLNSYWRTQTTLLSQATLSPQEINIVQTTVAHENECQYCVAGHTAFGKTPVFENTDAQLQAIRTGESLGSKKLDTLRSFTLRVLETKGRVRDAELEEFLSVGYTRANALEIVACIAAKVMSNFANQIAMTPIDEAFAPLAEGLPYLENRELVTA